MKITLPDGYIEMLPTNNVFCGNNAQEVMHATERIQRKTKASFNDCLKAMLKELIALV